MDISQITGISYTINAYYVHKHTTYVRIKEGGQPVMNIGDRIAVNHGTTDITMTEITNVIPVQYKDDGDESWYEVCDANKTDLVAIVGKDGSEDVIITINKETCDTSLLLDLL